MLQEKGDASKRGLEQKLRLVSSFFSSLLLLDGLTK